MTTSSNMKIRIRIPYLFRFIILLLSCQLISFQSSGQEVKLTVLAHLPPVLEESSGLAITENGNIWTLVDSKLPVIYNINTEGKVLRFLYLNHKNQDWEDMAKDEDGNFYIGNFGNNANKRQNLRIIKIPPPDSIRNDTIVNGGVIHFSYPDQKTFPPKAGNANFDMEAMICMNNSIYLFSKNRTKPFTGYSKVYKLPNTPGKYVAQLIDSVYLGPGEMLQTWVTSADLSPDKKILALLTHDKVWLFYCFKGDKFFSGKKKTIELLNFSQKEGISFINNKELYITDELTKKILGGNLYHLKLDRNYAEVCK